MRNCPRAEIGSIFAAYLFVEPKVCVAMEKRWSQRLVFVREQNESFESVSDPLLNSLNPLPFSPLFLNLGGCWGVDQ